MINFEITFDGEFKAPDEATLRRGIAMGLKEAGEQIQNQTRKNFGGRPGPKTQTGKLVGSIHNEVSTDGLSLVIGSPISYAPRVELGFQGTEKVRAHQRRMSMAWGRPIKGGPQTVKVKAFERSVNAPAYPYLRPAIQAAMNAHLVEDLINSNIAFELAKK